MKALWQSNRGTVAVWVALSLPLLLGFSALAIDTAHLVVVKNELQSAADAGALAGARFLYDEDGFVNAEANRIAYDATRGNTTQAGPVEIHWTSGNSGDIQVGHWDFDRKEFTPANESHTKRISLKNESLSTLNFNKKFINAVRVVARQSNPQGLSLIGWMSGESGFEVKVEAIAHIGFSGNLFPKEMDAPIAICEQALQKQNDNERFLCGKDESRYMSMGREVRNRETGGWTDFEQEDPCTSTVSGQELKNLICAAGNPEYIELKTSMATKCDDSSTAFTKLYTCWKANSANRTKPWPVTLPVIDCDGNNIDRCERVVGAVRINIIWITGANDDYDYSDAPRKMGGWSDNDWDGRDRWESFGRYFKFKSADQFAETSFPWTSVAWACHDEDDVPYEKKTIYYFPECSYYERIGTGGGKNFGVLAKIPTLVK